MNTIPDALQKLGELFIIGFEGTELSDDTAAFISQAGIGGVLLFAHNYKDPKQLAELTNAVQECRAGTPLWVAVDQEGGRVQRFKDPFTILPTGEQLAKAASPKAAFEIGEICAKELKAVGINLNFAPCADVLTNPENEVIGDRSFGSDGETVSRIVTAVVRGHVVGGVQPCVKHFVGHGATKEDSHDELPVIDISFDELKDRDFKPFVKTFKSRCNMVMTAHIINKALDPDFPITLSKKILQDMLRKDLRYSRIIISDDLEMKAITDNYTAEKAPIMAIDAGCDMLIYRSEDAARKAYESLRKAVDAEELPAERIIESADKIRSLKKDVLGTYQPVNIGEINEIVGNPKHKEAVAKFI